MHRIVDVVNLPKMIVRLVILVPVLMIVTGIATESVIAIVTVVIDGIINGEIGMVTVVERITGGVTIHEIRVVVRVPRPVAGDRILYRYRLHLNSNKIQKNPLFTPPHKVV